MSTSIAPPFPRKLSTQPMSPYYDRDACDHVKRVLVDGVYHGGCVAYDMDAGWGQFEKPLTRQWTGKVYGVITVELK